MSRKLRDALLAGFFLASWGCGGKDRKAGPTAEPGPVASAPVVAAGTGDVRWRVESYRELDGEEENSERLIATVTGSPVDSMTVRLEIRTSKDGLLYRHEWPATSYMKYLEEGSAKDTARVLRETQRQLGLLFADSQFVSGAAAGGHAAMREPDADAIRFDLAEQQYRGLKKLDKWSALRGAAWDEVNTIAKTISDARINAIIAETPDKPAFMYYAGGEETYIVAWSPTEQRMVRIAACC